MVPVEVVPDEEAHDTTCYLTVVLQGMAVRGMKSTIVANNPVARCA